MLERSICSIRFSSPFLHLSCHFLSTYDIYTLWQMLEARLFHLKGRLLSKTIMFFSINNDRTNANLKKTRIMFMSADLFHSQNACVHRLV